MIGPLVGADEVCDAARATLQAWLPSVLAELHATGRYPLLPPPATYDMPDFDALREGKGTVPAVGVSSAGGAAAFADENGVIGGTWQIIANVVARGASYAKTAQAVRGYVLAVRTVLLQNPTLGGFASDLSWEREEYAALASTAARTLGAGFVTVNVTVDAVTDPYAGPRTPPDPVAVAPAPPTVLTTDVDVTRETS